MSGIDKMGIKQLREHCKMVSKLVMGLEMENNDLKIRCEQLAISRNSAIDKEEILRKKLNTVTDALLDMKDILNLKGEGYYFVQKKVKETLKQIGRG